eukprot:scaffold27122_cov34-Isochrysis_galbana.AAC.1
MAMAVGWRAEESGRERGGQGEKHASIHSALLNLNHGSREPKGALHRAQVNLKTPFTGPTGVQGHPHGSSA